MTEESNFKPQLGLKTLTFSDNRVYEIGPNEVVILVGPNNAGKSQSLRDIQRFISSLPGFVDKTVCVKEITLEKNCSVEELKKFLEEDCRFDVDHYRLGPYIFPVGAITFWDGDNLGSQLGAAFCKFINAEQRLAASKTASSLSPDDNKALAAQILYDNVTLTGKISDLFRDTFGYGLVINYRGGSKIPIHIGEEPARAEGEDRVDDYYVEKVKTLPNLEQQGDGMRSFAGILFEAIVVNHDITLLDEPEAYLHPPQMRKLGAVLAKENSKQLFVATHSSDILRGFLDDTSAQIRVIRLQRDGNVNVSHESAPETVRDLWISPDLKYSNALEAIFHEQAVLCEDDSDCRFYNAIADYLEADANEKWPDTHFVPCGGKGAIPKLAKALTALGVPTKIVGDIDVLSDQQNCKAMVDSLGGNWSHFERDFKIIDSDVRKGVKPLTNKQIKKQIVEIVTEAEEDDLPKSDVITCLKQNTPWSQIKGLGRVAIPPGDASAAYDRLDVELRKLGIYLVPEGEIEGFYRKIGKHGPRFVSEVLRTVPLNSPELTDARAFVGSIFQAT